MAVLESINANNNPDVSTNEDFYNPLVQDTPEETIFELIKKY